MSCSCRVGDECKCPMFADLQAENEKLRAEQVKDLADVDRFRGMARRYMDERDALKAEVQRLRGALASIQALVDEQAEDEGLWCHAETIHEAYIQQGLRKLHAVIEALQEPESEKP